MLSKEWHIGREEHFMKRLSMQRTYGFARRELVVVIFVLVALFVLCIPALKRARQRSWVICCNCNMKELGTAYRLWAGDHGNQVPSMAPLTNGGWKELLTNSNVGPSCWTNYVVMADYVGRAPAVLVCPNDERRPAKDFGASFTNNSTVSYFVGVNANDAYPQSIAGGDRNLGPGTVPRPDYGYSPANGQGNDVIINGPVCWSLKMHSGGNASGFGNILLGDGSAQQVSSASFNMDWLRNAQDAATTPAGATNGYGIRLLFP